MYNSKWREPVFETYTTNILHSNRFKAKTESVLFNTVFAENVTKPKNRDCTVYYSVDFSTRDVWISIEHRIKKANSRYDSINEIKTMLCLLRNRRKRSVIGLHEERPLLWRKEVHRQNKLCGRSRNAAPFKRVTHWQCVCVYVYIFCFFRGRKNPHIMLYTYMYTFTLRVPAHDFVRTLSRK